MSFLENNLCSFANDERLAFCSPDGNVLVYDVKTGEQIQRHFPSSQLAYSCLAWKTECIPPGTLRRRKKLCISKSQSSKTGELIALGTTSGDVVLFNVVKGELASKFIGGHSNRINCISWGKGNAFYSCSSDQHIVEWSMGNSTHLSKWKAEKKEVYSIAVGPYSKTILSAGKLIKLWDLKSKLLLRKYASHSTPVFSLTFLNTSSISSQEGASALELLDGLYFLSAASDERTLNAWQIKNEKHKKTATCSFNLPTEPRLVDMLPPLTQDKPTQALAVTDDEQIVLFSYVLNGPTKKPLLPTKSIRIVTEDATPLKVICASFKKTTVVDIAIIVAYGDTSGVAFEQVVLSDHAESDIVLVRKDPKKREVFMEQDQMKSNEPVKSEEMSSTEPGATKHSGKSGRKRKKQLLPAEAQITMEERLKALNAEEEPVEDLPFASDLAVLLSETLQSGDDEALNQALEHGNKTLILDTVRQLPLSSVIPLVKELSRRLKDIPERCLIIINWMKVVLDFHSAYIMTFPDVVPLLGKLNLLLDVRSQAHSRLSKLEGKLDLIMSQIVSRQAQTASESSKEPLFVFEDDSSDEQEDMDGVISSHLDSLDKWDDLSDFEDKNVATDGLASGDEELMIDEG